MKKSVITPSGGAVSGRVRVLLCIFGLSAIYLLAVLFRMQLFEYGYYQEKVLNQITVGSSAPAKRGNIYGQNGELLATTQTVYRIYLSPVAIKDAKKRTGIAYDSMIANYLSTLLGVEYSSVLQKANQSGFLDQTVKRNQPEEIASQVLLFIRENGLEDMLHTEAGIKRYYPFSGLACHAMGFTGSDGQGLFGLEAYYQAILAGKSGAYVTAVDSRGIKLPMEYADYQEGEEGLSLVTTLDVYVQRQLEYQLEKARIAANAQNRTTGIVMNVKTGAVLGMATSPSFDLNDPYTLDGLSEEKLIKKGFEKDTPEYKAEKTKLLYEMWNNKAVTELYEPGSTFKIFTASVGIETGAVTPSDLFNCPGYYMVGGCRISCHKHGGHGTVTFAQGLMQSCNPCMMQTAERIGKDAFYSYYQAFGYQQKTGIDLPGESVGLFHSLSSLGSTELATASFGQRFKVSVLNQLCAVAAVANGGTPVAPHLLSSVIDGDGNVVYQYETQEMSELFQKAGYE
ncbi:MAG: hypothetical protein MJ078_05070, partial [Clostridia bacterium]|nr:hypothetical protein [Clostridia bacterium]